MAVDKGDVDGELAIALDEFARAVEGVHQPVAPPVCAFGKGDGRGLFGEKGQARRQRAQALPDDVVGSQVRLGQ